MTTHATTPQPPRGIETRLGLQPEAAWMNYVLRNALLCDGTTIVPHTIPVWSPRLGKFVDMIFGSVDGGNSSNKLAFIGEPAAIQLSTGEKRLAYHMKLTHVPTAYQARQKIRHGEGKVSWRITNGKNPEYFWMGSHVVAEGDALPNGSTLQRMAHKRYVPFTLATIIDGLIAAGHTAEIIDATSGKSRIDEKHLALAYGVRDDEIESVGGKQFMEPTLEQSLNDLARTWIVERYDPDGTPHTWHLTIHFVFPAAQTLGSVFAYLFTLPGGYALSKKKILVFDGGQKDLQKLLVSLQGGLNATGGTIGNGAVLLTNALMEAAKDFSLQLTPAQAHQALKEGVVLLGGDETPLHQIIEPGVRDSQVESIIGAMMSPIDIAADAHLLFTGGLACIAQKEILEMIGHLKRTRQQFYLCDCQIAASMNAIGLLAYSLYQLIKKKNELDQSPEAVIVQNRLREQGTPPVAPASGSSKYVGR